jgi:hypothetical protein
MGLATAGDAPGCPSAQPRLRLRRGASGSGAWLDATRGAADGQRRRLLTPRWWRWSRLQGVRLTAQAHCAALRTAGGGAARG